MNERRLGFAVKVLGRRGLASHDTRRWQSNPSIEVSIDALHRILDYLAEVGVRMYRMSSDFVPYATHPDHPRFHRQIEEHAGALAGVGRRAQELDIRLSLHPSQYTVLNAADAEVARKARWDLDVQASLLDAMEQDAAAVVVIHVGGGYGDREAALERFVRSFEQLGEAARRRVVIENDDTVFTVADCLWVHRRTAAPIVFDHHHHRLNPGEATVYESVLAAATTWPTAVTPKIHFSSPRLDGRTVGRGKAARTIPPRLRQHADYVDPWTFAALLKETAGVDFDVMLEAKAKDLALLKLRADLLRLGQLHVLARP